MEQGKKKLISGADEFVEARKDQLEKERQQKDKQQQEKGAQDQEFHKTQAQQNEQFLKNEQHLSSERARLHNEQQQRREQHNAQQQGGGVKFLPPENQFGDEQKKELAPRNDALANDAHKGGFAENQMRAQAESRAEFEKAEGKVLVTCQEKPEDVKPMNPQLDEQREKAQGRSM
jgi:hypothetical protein